jgi:hypothetical protein
MSQLVTIIPLSQEEKDLYCKLSFKYFLDLHLETENVVKENIEQIHKGYSDTLFKIISKKKKNRAQYHLFIEGYVRKMNSGGILATHFNLSEARSFNIINYYDYGENWAYFETWAKWEKLIKLRKLIWKRFVEIGALIGFILAAIHIFQIFSK